jgi:hypothetical protein
LRKPMIMHIKLNCLRSFRLVPLLIFQMTSSQEGKDDEDITASDTTIPSIEL